MMRTVVLIFALMLGVVISLASKDTHANVTWEPDGFRISVTLPGRWSLGTSKETPYWAWVNFIDQQKAAFVFLRVVTLGRKGRSNIQTWMKEDEIPRRLTRYSEGYGYNVQSQKESAASLASGQQAQVIRYQLEINGNYRDVAFVYFTDDPGLYWFSAFIFPTGRSGNVAKSIEVILQGIILR